MKNACERMVILCRGDEVSLDDLPARAARAGAGDRGGCLGFVPAASAGGTLPGGSRKRADRARAAHEGGEHHAGGGVPADPPAHPRLPDREIRASPRCLTARGGASHKELLEDLRPIFTTRMVLSAWIPCLVITVLHYRTGAHHAWGHDILRRLYYLPILFAAFSGGMRGGGHRFRVRVPGLPPLTPSRASWCRTPRTPWRRAWRSSSIISWRSWRACWSTGSAASGSSRNGWRPGWETPSRSSGGSKRSRSAPESLGALGEMTAGIAHEIKNPLHALKGTAEILRDAVPEGVPERRMLELHIEEIDRLGQTADRFLSFARPIPASLCGRWIRNR